MKISALSAYRLTFCLGSFVTACSSDSGVDGAAGQTSQAGSGGTSSHAGAGGSSAGSNASGGASGSGVTAAGGRAVAGSGSGGSAGSGVGGGAPGGAGGGAHAGAGGQGNAGASGGTTANGGSGGSNTGPVDGHCSSNSENAQWCEIWHATTKEAYALEQDCTNHFGNHKVQCLDNFFGQCVVARDGSTLVKSYYEYFTYKRAQLEPGAKAECQTLQGVYQASP